ncbi:MAG TPA: glycoside hydrolase [Chloroflexi bacterium]|nr:glycoside hydrolase [Chloroflexota bacterium]HBY08988.1 glycoside hydrolase [Chloroflexota bacterium]
MDDLLLLPAPRRLKLTGGEFPLPKDGFISLQAAHSADLLFTARQLQTALQDFADVDYAIGAAGGGDFVLSVVPGSVAHPQGYELTITGERVFAVASTLQGCFYAVQTLIQILNQSRDRMPQLRCSDWPDFAQRGVMLDISRDKVPTMETLYRLIDLLAGWKVNQFQLYTEHTFAYRNHRLVWEKASPLTGEEILQLDAYCRDRFVELVPNQNVFGHMHRWLEHPEYAHLAEAPEGAQTPWGFFNPQPFSISPVVPESLELVRELLDELLPHFSSAQVNVGCDETYDVGQGQSKALAAEIGADRVYLNFVKQIYREVKSRGKVMQFWGDIIMEHPNLVPDLPRDAIALEWGYEAEHPFDEHGALFAASGIPFYVCPGTSSWNTVAGRTANALENLRNAAENGIKHGAAGYLNTDWGDNGHWQPLPVSYLGFAYGAGVSWGYGNNQQMPVPEALSRFAFRDQANLIGKILYDLGNVHQKISFPLHNSTVLFRILQVSLDELENYAGEAHEIVFGLRETLPAIDTIMAALDRVDLQRPDADLICRELTWAADMLRHACQRGIWAFGKIDGAEDVALRAVLADDAARLIAEYEQIWLARNRPGGFAESVARMKTMQTAYA